MAKIPKWWRWFVKGVDGGRGKRWWRVGGGCWSVLRVRISLHRERGRREVKTEGCGLAAHGS